MNNKIRKIDGFTLVELLFVVVLMSILMLTVMRVITQVQASSQTAKEIRDRSAIASRIFSELKLQFSTKGNGSLSNLGQSTTTTSSSGPRVISYEPDPNRGNNKILRIVTLGTRYANPKIPILYGEVEARYYLTPDNNNRFKLVLEFWPILTSPTSTNNSSSEVTTPILQQTITTNIKDLSFRFRTASGWINDLGSSFGFTPNLIEVTLSMYGEYENSDIETYRTALPFGPTVR